MTDLYLANSMKSFHLTSLNNQHVKFALSWESIPLLEEISPATPAPQLRRCSPRRTSAARRVTRSWQWGDLRTWDGGFALASWCYPYFVSLKVIAHTITTYKHRLCILCCWWLSLHWLILHLKHHMNPYVKNNYSFMVEGQRRAAVP